MRPFTKDDWMGLQGAESFEDGSPPQIGSIYVEQEEGIIVAAKGGISILWDGHENWLGLEEISAVLIVMLAEKIEEAVHLTKNEMLNMGFVCMA